MKNSNVIAGLLASAMIVGAVAPAFAEDRQRGGSERASFSELDLDGNGEVTQAEIDSHRLARFNALDTNGDGSLSAEEMAAAASERQIERAEKRIERMIDRRDENGNGTIEFGEMGNSERAAERFAEADADGSGGLSEEEMTAAKKERGGKRRGGG